MSPHLLLQQTARKMALKAYKVAKDPMKFIEQMSEWDLLKKNLKYIS